MKLYRDFEKWFYFKFGDFPADMLIKYILIIIMANLFFLNFAVIMVLLLGVL
tara:strand:+ start:1112 stop:1267 length:156 start_codon:yes stop_codon:yes gene_type:complete